MGSINVTNLGKAYKQYPSRWARLVEWLMPGHKPRHMLKWVLQDINFSVNPGEAVGIIGVNGAGKSTLLKMITGTTRSTTGSVSINGRVAALLELGMGFHADFTGRQNVYMSGQLLGYSVDEITSLMPEIEAFAEIGDYIDQPVRVYSSGMQVRLAFAVATANHPDILIIDEALSVGDAAFQRKCFQRIESYRDAGTTLLFVSHDIETIKKLCDSALFIKDGRLKHFGAARQVCDEYERYIFGGRPDRKKTVANKKSKQASAKFDPSLVASCRMNYGNGKAEISNVRLEDELGNHINVVESGMEFCLAFDVFVLSSDISRPFVNMQIKTTDGVVVYGINSKHLNVREIPIESGCIIETRFALENCLAPGTYFFTCGLKERDVDDENFCHRVVDAVILRVVDREDSTVARGIVDMRANLKLVRLGGGA